MAKNKFFVSTFKDISENDWSGLKHRLQQSNGRLVLLVHPFFQESFFVGAPDLMDFKQRKYLWSIMNLLELAKKPAGQSEKTRRKLQAASVTAGFAASRKGRAKGGKALPPVVLLEEAWRTPVTKKRLAEMGIEPALIVPTITQSSLPLLSCGKRNHGSLEEMKIACCAEQAVYDHDRSMLIRKLVGAGATHLTVAGINAWTSQSPLDGVISNSGRKLSSLVQKLGSIHPSVARAQARFQRIVRMPAVSLGCAGLTYSALLESGEFKSVGLAVNAAYPREPPPMDKRALSARTAKKLH